MSSIKVEEGQVTLRLTLTADYTNEDHEPVLETKALRVPRDHPLVEALVDVWHLGEESGEIKIWVERPHNDANVRTFLTVLEDVLTSFFASRPTIAGPPIGNG
jgi:hypothetical protein